MAERYIAPGVSFVALEGDQPAVATAAPTRRDSSHLLTAAFLRAHHRGGNCSLLEPAEPIVKA